MAKPKRPVPSTDPKLKGKLEAAMAAGGFDSPEALLAALHAEVKPKAAQTLETMTASMTVAEVGQSLYAKLMQPGGDKESFYKGLTKEQKMMLVVYLTHIGFAPPAIASNLGTTEGFVTQAWRQYSDKLGQEVMSIRLQTIVGDLQARADQLYEHAMKDGKTAVAWKIRTDFVKLLQDLNIVERAAHKQEVTHKLTLDEAGMMELDELLELREKKKRAQQRITVEPAEGDDDRMPALGIDLDGPDSGDPEDS